MIYTIQTDWSEFKTYLDQAGGALHYLTTTLKYKCYLSNGDFRLYCELKRNGNADVVDFEANYQASGNPQLTDASGRVINREAITTSGWAMHNVFLDITTSTLAAVTDNNKDGTSRNIASCKFYDNTNTELVAGTQEELDTKCVKTVVEVNFPFDIGLMGGRFYCHNISNTMHLWATVAPHIPAASGGSIEFVSQANLKEIGEFIIDGRAPKLIANDDTYLSDKWEFVITHGTGVKETIVMCYEAYKHPTSVYV